MKLSCIIAACYMAGVGLAAPAKGASGLEQRISNRMAPVDGTTTKYTLSDGAAILENTSPDSMTKREEQTFGLILDWLKKAYGLDGHCVCLLAYRKREEQTFGLIYDLIKKVLSASGFGQDNCHCNSYGNTSGGSAREPAGGSTGSSTGSLVATNGDGSGFGAVLGPNIAKGDGSDSASGKVPDITSILSPFLGKEHGSKSGSGDDKGDLASVISSILTKGLDSGTIDNPKIGGSINSTLGKPMPTKGLTIS